MTPPNGWVFAVQEGLVPGRDLDEKVARLADWGYGGLEVSGADLLRRPDELRRATAGGPVRLTTACAGFRGWLVDPDPGARAAAVTDIEEMLAVCAELGLAGLVAPAAYGIDSRDMLHVRRGATGLAHDRALLVDGLARVAASAARTGGTLLLEPLNRYVDRVLNTLDEAASVVEEVDSPHVRLVADLFHMNIEEADPPGALRRHGDLLAHVHLSDSNRLAPGRGHLAFAAAFEALRDVGYTGALAIECRLDGAPDETLPGALRFLERTARAASAR